MNTPAQEPQSDIRTRGSDGPSSTTEQPPYSVHTEESTNPDGSQVPYTAYRRHRVKDEWPHTLALYQHIDHLDGRSRSENLVNCGKFAFFTRNKQSGHVRVASSKCGLRWCPCCAESRAGFIAMNLTDRFTSLKYPKFLTLTLKHSADSLTDQINRLYDAFKSLRKRKSFKTAVNGGIWFFQIKLTDVKKQWHPHLHCIVTGKFIPQCQIKRLWLECTGDSSIVDIRMVRDPAKVAEYVSRYAARPCKLNDKTLTEQMDLFEAMHQRKICGTWGDCSEIKLCPSKKINRDEWENLGSWSTVWNFAKFDHNAQRIITAWQSHKPLDNPVSFAPTDLELDKGAWGQDDTIQANPPPDYTASLFA